MARGNQSGKLEVVENGGFNHRLEVLRGLVKSIASEIEEIVEGQPEERAKNHNGFELSFDEQVRKFEFDLIKYALFRAGGRQNKAAELLKLKPTTLNWKIKRYNIPFNGINRSEEINDRQVT